MTTGFLTVSGDGRLADLDDLLVRRDLFSEGILWNWGFNTNGQLGDNTSSNRSSPVTTAGGGINWKQAATSGSFSAGIKTDGRLWLWGYNLYGQLGDNTSSQRTSPVNTVAGGTNWKQVALGASGSHAAAIKTDGTLWTWGSNTNGQLGDNTSSSRSSPVTTVGGQGSWKQTSAGGAHTAAIKTDGTLWSWGRNDYGILGDNTSSSRSSPVTTVAAGTTWKQVACGYLHTAAIKTDGTLWTWGRNDYGQLGDNTSSSRSSPVTTAGGGTNWKQVACGAYHLAAIKTDGTIWNCGYNGYGNLGDETLVSKSSFVTPSGGGRNWKQVTCGGNHTAAIKTDGTLWTWGRDQYGQIGDNTSSNRSSPVTPVGGIINWKQVSAGGADTIGVTDLTL